MEEPVHFRLPPRIAQLVREARDRRQAKATHLVHVAAEVGARDAIELFRRRHRQVRHRCCCSICTEPLNG